jgi:cystathionine beta-lyase
VQKMAESAALSVLIIVTNHADLILPGSHHHPLASLSPAIADQVITLMAPSKTFNIPGIGSSFFIIHKEERRKQYQQYLESINQKEAPLFAVLCTQAAYEQGDDWLNQLLRYLHRNVQYVTDFIESELPVLQACSPQASFLIWIDCRQLNLNSDELSRFFVQQAGLGLNPGHSFGPGGEGFMRLNIGCRKEVVNEAMERLKRATITCFS